VVLDKPYKRKHGKQEEFLKVVLNAPWVSSRTAAPSAPVLETVVFSTKSFDVYESASSAGPWVKVDAATLKRDYPTIFLP
jgi:hypothetical protein